MSNTDSATAPAGTDVPAGGPPVFNRSDLIILLGAGLATVLAGVSFYGKLSHILTFVLSAAAIAMLASLVGRCVERLADLPLVGMAYLRVESLLTPPGPWARQRAVPLAPRE
jgi:hypothetical protein